MYVNIGLIVFSIFCITVSTLFCTFFSAHLAALKGRSKAWGILGFLISFIGLVIVCFLPPKEYIDAQTNPIIYAFSKMSLPSRRTISLLIGIVLAVTITVIAYDNIPIILENYKYSKEVTKQNAPEYEQPKIIKAKVENIFIGSESTFAVSDTGDVYCWGRQHAKQIEKKDRGIIFINAKKVLANEHALLVLANDGNLYGIGDNSSFLLPSDKESADDFVLICKNVSDFDISETSIGIINNKNELFMYGNNAYGQLGTGNTKDITSPVRILTNVISVNCADSFTIAITDSNDAVAFGKNYYNQFGILEEFLFKPVTIHKNIIQAASGDDFILLLSESGELFACGNNSHGQLGNSSKENFSEFTEIMSGVKYVSAGGKSAFALKTDGTLYSWGANITGQLGNGNESSVLNPVQVLNDVSTVVTSGTHTAVLTNKGKILSTGYNSYGQLGCGQSRNKFSSLVSIK